MLARPAFRALDASRLGACDGRFAAAVATLACVELPAFGGTTAVLGDDVILEPHARYDLRLSAVASDPDASGDVLVAVTNFVASPVRLRRVTCSTRSGSPTRTLRRCCRTTRSSAPNRPAARARSWRADAAFDATLAELGLDPWPLPTRPRVVALWRPGAPWSFVGLLLEADEPIERSGRLHVDSVTVGGATLDVVRQSSSGARVLATPVNAVTLDAEDIVAVVLSSTTVDSGGVAHSDPVGGTRRLLDQPRLAYAEVDQ